MTIKEVSKPKGTPWAQKKKELFTASQLEQIEERTRELNREMMALKQLRKVAGKTQGEMAALMEVSQPKISQMENPGVDRLVSSVRNYVEALGGDLALVATIDGKEVRLDL